MCIYICEYQCVCVDSIYIFMYVGECVYSSASMRPHFFNCCELGPVVLTSVFIRSVWLHVCIHLYPHICVVLWRAWRGSLGCTTRGIHMCDVCDMTAGCDTIYRHVWYDSSTCGVWLIYICDIIHLCVWYDSSPCVIWFINVCDMIYRHVWYDCRPFHVWHDSSMCVIWIIHMCDMIHRHVWHDPFTCVTWFIDMYDTIHRYVWHDCRSSWFIDMCDMIHSHVWHDSSICVSWFIHMRDMIHRHVAYIPSICMTWL